MPRVPEVVGQEVGDAGVVGQLQKAFAFGQEAATQMQGGTAAFLPPNFRVV